MKLNISWPQIENYLENNITSSSECADNIIIKPVIDSTIVGFDIDIDEAHSASSLLGNAVGGKVGKFKTITKDEFPNIKQCPGRVVLVKVENYYRASGTSLGRFTGTISVIIYFFASVNNKHPFKKYKFSATGKRQWGDSTPFNSAVNEVVKKIRRSTFSL